MINSTTNGGDSHPFILQPIITTGNDMRKKRRSKDQRRKELMSKPSQMSPPTIDARLFVLNTIISSDRMIP